MFNIRVNCAAGLVVLLFAATGVLAADDPEDVKKRMGAGDPVAGKVKSTFCQTCHGTDGNSATSNYPKLAGQYADYIQKQVNEFKSGDRKDPMMSAMAQSVASDEDLLDIAAYFASQDQMKSPKPVANKAGEALFSDAGNGCNTCHGINGKGLAPEISQAPVIGGQHKDYLLKQLKGFKKHTRTNDPGGMMGMVTGFMTDEDMEAAASYISGL